MKTALLIQTMANLPAKSKFIFSILLAATFVLLGAPTLKAQNRALKFNYDAFLQQEMQKIISTQNERSIEETRLKLRELHLRQLKADRQLWRGEKTTVAPPTTLPLGAGNLDAGFNAGVDEGFATVEKVKVQPDGKILVAGFFTSVNNSRRTSLVRLNADGTLDNSFVINPAITDVRAIELQPDGKILVGGFLQINGSLTSFIRLNADGSFDASFTPPSIKQIGFGNVTAFSVQADGSIVVGGLSFEVNNTERSIIKVGVNGSLDLAFNNFSGPNGGVETIVAQPDGKLLIGGSFDQYNGIARSNIARVNDDGSLDTTFGIIFLNGAVNTIALQTDGKVLLGGSFRAASGFVGNQIARFNADGSLDSTFNPIILTVLIRSIIVQPDGKIVAGGYNLSTLNSRLDGRVVRYNADGSVDASLNLVANNFVSSLALQNNNSIVIGGYFSRLGNAVKKRIARLSLAGGIDPNFNAEVKADGFVSDIAEQSNGKIIVSGDFEIANGALRRNLIRFNADGSLDNSFNPSFTIDSTINTVAVQPDGKILIGGFFRIVNGVLRSAIARLNADGTLDNSFALNNLLALFVEKIRLQPDGKILIGGALGFGSSANLVRLNSDGNLDTTFSLEPGVRFAGVREIVLQPDNKILIGGSSRNFGGAVVSSVTRLNANGTIDTTFNPSAETQGSVYSLALQADGRIVIGGIFFDPNEMEAPREILRLNSNGSLDTSFNSDGSAVNGVIYSILILPDNKILLGGSFSAASSPLRVNLLQLNGNGTVDPSFTSGFVLDNLNLVYVLRRQANGKIIVGGFFNSYNGVTKQSLLRLNSGATKFDFDGDGRADISVFRPDNGQWYVQNSQNGFFNFQFGQAGDRIVPADYDGDGKTDFAVYRNGTWFLQRSATGFASLQFGAVDDVPQPADFDGDGKAEIAVWRPSNGVWYIYSLINNQLFQTVQFGASNDKPVAADYNGDGRAEVAVWRPENGIWYTLNLTNSQSQIVQFGANGDKPVYGDYDADGKTDFGVYRPSSGVWYLQRSTAGFSSLQFGAATDLPAPADYDGDGRTDLAVFRLSNGVWYVQNSTAGFSSFQFGASGDKPVPNSFVP